MNSSEIAESRIKKIRSSSTEGKCVLYIMSRDQRVRDNQALLCAQKHALEKKLPLAVVFCLYEKAGVRSREHYEFMIKGLEEVEKDLKLKNIPFMLVIGDANEKLSAVIHHTEPDAAYFDFSPLRGPRKLQERLSSIHDTKMFVVDAHNVVPVWVTSDKKEFGAYTIRPKIHKKLADYLAEPDMVVKHPHAWPGVVQTITSLKPKIDEIISRQTANNTKHCFDSGEKAAAIQLQKFIDTKLASYAVDRNDPTQVCQSDLSPYLHFGQISALRVALSLQEEANKNDSELHLLYSPKMPKPENTKNTVQHGIDTLIEEIIVRKELADNFCYFEPYYDDVKSAPEWAQKTLNEHRKDPREQVYTLKELERAKTHDEAWNAAQRQLTTAGKMHGYMRMYWAKKILEWTETPEEAFEILAYLNDHYSIDGADPNGYAGIAWSVCGVHDRAWNERDIFGKIRYMNFGGLKRKFDIDAYIKQWQ